MSNFNEENLDGLFGSLDRHLGAVEKTEDDKNEVGIYKVDMSKITDKKTPYRAVLRFLPNFRTNGTLGDATIEKMTHFVKIENNRELSGYYDSPRNFKDKCALTDLYFKLNESSNIILKERSKCLDFNRKYYSYVMVMEDKHQPELVGKIMVFPYGKQILTKIQQEKSGILTGEECVVFDLVNGKDFVLVVNEKEDRNRTYPDYTSSFFKQTKTPISFLDKNTGEFKQIPTENGQVASSARAKVRDLLLDRSANLDDFAPKPLSGEQTAKIQKIVSILSGEVTSYNAPDNSDFEMGDSFETKTSFNTSSSTSIDEEDFFS